MSLRVYGLPVLFTNSIQCSSLRDYSFQENTTNKETNQKQRHEKNKCCLLNIIIINIIIIISFFFLPPLHFSSCFILTPLFERTLTQLLQFHHENILTFLGNQKNSEKRKWHLTIAKFIVRACSESWQDHALRAAHEWLFLNMAFFLLQGKATFQKDTHKPGLDWSFVCKQELQRNVHWWFM